MLQNYCLGLAPDRNKEPHGHSSTHLPWWSGEENQTEKAVTHRLR